MKKLYEEASVQDIADAIREKTGGAETYRIAQMASAVRSIPGGDQIAHADIPDYVKDGVLALAQKVQAVKTASSIVFVTVADAHHATDESTGWKANIEAGNMDACRAIKALSHVTPLDFAAFLGDLTFGYKTTTAAQFEAQCREFHRWLEEGLRGIPQLWTPGNHDTGEYFAAETGSLTNLYGAALIRKYFSDYNAGAGYDRTLSFDFAVIMRAVRTTLTGCCGSNAATAVEDGAAYTTTLTPKNGYTFDTVRVSMGGTDITATAYNAETGVVSVARVTGDITITATASKPVTYTNVVPTAVDSSGASLPYQEGYNLSSSGDVQEENGFVTTGFIPLSGNVTKHIYRIGGDGIIFSKTEEHSRVGWYDSTFQLLGNVMPAKKIDTSVYYPSSIPESATAMTFQVTEAASNVPASAAYFRVSAKGKGANLIITIDEPIE